MQLFRKILLLCVVLSSTVLGSWAQGGTQIALSDFDKISTKGKVQLVLNPGAAESSIAVELYGIKKFKYEVKKGVLQIDVPTGIFAPKGYLKVIVSTPTLSEVEVQGAEVECLAPVVGESFVFKTFGSKNIAKLWADVDRLTLNVDGSSDVAVRGATDNANLYAALGSRIDALELVVDDIYVKARQGAEVYALGQKSITARMNSGATLYWGGSAEVSGINSFGGGIVEIARNGYEPMFDKYSYLELNQPFVSSGEAGANELPEKSEELKEDVVREDVVQEVVEQTSDEDFF